MKRFNAGEWILLMLAFSVSVVLVISVAGIVFKGNTQPNEGAVQIRTALIDLLKVIVGGVLGAVAAIKSSGENK